MAVERTEDAIHSTDIRVIGIRVHDEGHVRVGILLEADLVCEIAKVKQVSITKHEQPFFWGESLLPLNFLVNPF
jgi:hypothetical protein